MPRQADHEQRRRQIAEAVWRLAERGGLEDVTLRQVAVEAGVSMRLVQYYFGTRQQLLLGALELLNADAERQAQERVAALGEEPRAILRGVLLELLPLDEERRTRQVVHAAYFIRFLADAELAEAVRRGAPALEDLVAHLIREGQRRDEVPAEVDAEAEAHFLVAGAWGLQGDLLLGQRTEENAVALVDHQLARLFPLPRGT